MEIAYHSERATVWLGDARDVLPLIPKESVDLAVTDPPYGVEYKSNFREQAMGGLANDGAHEREVVLKILSETVRLVGQKRHLYVFGPNDVLEGQKVSEVADLVWDKLKTGMGNLSSTWGPGHEPISFAVSMYRHAGQSGKSSPAVRMRKGSVLRFSPPTGRKVRHPTEKPLGLLMELIESSSRQGDLVLDPFAGVCSTGVAAVLRGRRAILVEIDQGYVDLGIERIKQAERAYEEMMGL
jgi:DNA modification methylase